MIDVVRLDYWAASGSGPYHRASTTGKIFFFLCIVAAAVLARNPYPLMTGFAVLIAVAAAANLPWFRVMVLSLYAAVFAILYALSFRASHWFLVLLVVKAVTPAFAMLMLIVSTPYPRIFSLLGRLLPEVIAAGLFMTYRTLFILLDMMGRFGAAMRLRGGFSTGSFMRKSGTLSKGIGMLLVRAVERASRLYAVMVVRGYNGSMAETGALRLTLQDWLPIGTGVIVLALVLFWK